MKAKLASMKWFFLRAGAIVLGLELLLAFGIGWESPLPDEAPLSDSGWRRTAHGWERTTNWRKPAPSPAPHPAVVTGLMVLVSLIALLGLPSPARWHVDRARERRQVSLYWPADRERRKLPPRRQLRTAA